jgi:hypothetical protein
MKSKQKKRRMCELKDMKKNVGKKDANQMILIMLNGGRRYWKRTL